MNDRNEPKRFAAYGRFIFIIMMVCGLAVNLVLGSDSQPSPQKKSTVIQKSKVVQLFYSRNANKISQELSNLKMGTAKMIEDDKILLIGDQDEQVEALERIVTLLDRPRPIIALRLLPIQVSYSTKSQQIEEEVFGKYRHEINEYNKKIECFLDSLWHNVIKMYEKENKPEVWKYVTRLYDRKSDGRIRSSYTLGYDLHVEGQPSLSRMLVLLALSSEYSDIDKVFKIPECVDAPKCEDNVFDDFSRTKYSIKNLFTKEKLKLFRAAIIDYLFHYKWSIRYKENFIPYDLLTSSARLDSFLDPVGRAFDMDIDKNITTMMKKGGKDKWPWKVPKKHWTWNLQRLQRKQGKQGIALVGQLKMLSISASQSKLDFHTQSNVYSLEEQASEMINKLLSITPQPTIPININNILAAFFQHNPSIEMGHGLSLKITAHSLPKASEAELDIELKIAESNGKSNNENKKSSLPDRIARAETNTKVRVPVARLFEVSTAALEVDVPGSSNRIFPILGHVWHSVFGSVPILDRFFIWPSQPKTIYHRHFVVSSAMVYPTAADVSLALRFHKDIGEKYIKEDKKRLDAFRDEHQEKMHKLLDPSSKTDQNQNNCSP